MSSGCKQLAKALKDLTLLPADQQKEALSVMQNFQCVECNQNTNISDITAGDSVNIDQINNIMSCGIGNSSSTDMVDQLRGFITDEKKTIQNDYNKKINTTTNSLNGKIQDNKSEILAQINKLMKIGGLILGVLSILILILIIMKIINL